ncbi:hypothetical protein D3C74_384440 [compost metagenome]
MIAHGYDSACLMPPDCAVYHGLPLNIDLLRRLIINRSQLIAVECGILSAGRLQLAVEFIRALQIIMLPADHSLSLQTV